MAKKALSTKTLPDLVKGAEKANNPERKPMFLGRLETRSDVRKARIELLRATANNCFSPGALDPFTEMTGRLSTHQSALCAQLLTEIENSLPAEKPHGVGE